MNVLVVAAHPDDEVLGCGGTMAKLASEGHDVHVCIVAEGISSRHNQRDQADRNAIAALAEKAKSVSAFLNARTCRLLGLPDNRLDSMALLDVIKPIEALVAELQPNIIFTQHGGDLNIDHLVVYRAVMTATRPMAGRSTRAVYGYEVGSSTEWAFRQFQPVFAPQLFIDISETLERKVSAMEMYESEARPFPHPRSPEALRAQARRWGANVGVLAAEAFSVVWELR
jgi:LmbE family N-acetylglucosaminyl deacetylase